MTAVDSPVVLSGGTKIEWAHFTFNPWWGCTRVSPACNHCYAEALAKRYGHGVWGKTSPRRFFGDDHWAEPLKWNRKAQRGGGRYRVFCASMADVFEDRLDLENERIRLWQLIEQTPHLDWMLLTKRPENITWMMPFAWLAGCPRNVWVGTTAEDQQRFDERVPHLLKVDAVVRFVSYEPALGPLDLDPTGLSLVIAGGETGHGARPAHPDWFRAVRDRCVETSVAFHFKQWGDWAPAPWKIHRDDHAGLSVDEFKREAERIGASHAIRPDGRVHEFDHRPWSCERSRRDHYPWVGIRRVGKKTAGRVLDGRTWDEMPEQRAVAS